MTQSTKLVEDDRVSRFVPAFVANLYARWFRDVWRAIDRDAAREREASGLGDRFDARGLWVFSVACIVLILQVRDTFLTPVRAFLSPRAESPWYPLFQTSFWMASRGFWYLAVPSIALWLAGLRVRDCGLSPKGFVHHIRIYVLLYLALLPALVVASFTEGFRHTYPFYGLASRSWTDLAVWELCYAFQFFGLEFFFRGFLLFVPRRVLGATAIFVMVVPYCMIHFRKPTVEMIGSIFAGVILGTLALRTRSIWGGVAIHVSVAVTMDVLSIVHSTGLPRMLCLPGS